MYTKPIGYSSMVTVALSATRLSVLTNGSSNGLSAAGLTPFNGNVYFVATDTGNVSRSGNVGSELWRFNTTTNGIEKKAYGF